MEGGDVTARLEALEARVEKLESRGVPEDRPQATAASTDGLWLIDGLQQTLPPGGAGAVAFGGVVTVPAGVARYQWSRPTEFLTEHPWDDRLERIAAVAHPVRGAILRRLLEGPVTVAGLVEEEVVTSSGTAYHHVGALAAAGWINKGPSGQLGIPVGRLVPLLTLLTCGEEH